MSACQILPLTQNITLKLTNNFLKFDSNEPKGQQK